MINGTADPIVRWNGGRVLRKQGTSEPIERVTQFWRDRACPGAAVERSTLPDRDADDDSTGELERVRCAGGEVVSYVVRGGGHTWPGGKACLPKLLVGPGNRDIDATAEILKFFEGHH